MIVYLDGKFVAAEEARVSVFDRGFLYGDGLFETLRIQKGKPFQWEAHVNRLLRGANALSIVLPPTGPLADSAAELCRLNAMPNAILRINVSRGKGTRGYSPRGAGPATIVLTLHPAPPLEDGPNPWRLASSAIEVSAHPNLTSCKHCNKLPNILARAHAEALGADEALMVDADGFVAEGSCSNLFWLSAGVLHTPPAGPAVLPGITRAFVVDWCSRTGMPLKEDRVPPAELLHADAVFLTLSSSGICEAIQLDSVPLVRAPLVQQVYRAWADALSGV